MILFWISSLQSCCPISRFEGEDVYEFTLDSLVYEVKTFPNNIKELRLPSSFTPVTDRCIRIGLVVFDGTPSGRKRALRTFALIPPDIFF